MNAVQVAIGHSIFVLILILNRKHFWLIATTKKKRAEHAVSKLDEKLSKLISKQKRENDVDFKISILFYILN